MKYSRLQVFDPPMCCSSGVCGPNVEPKLVRFSRDLDWLHQQGVEVERYNLSSDPAAFAGQGAVRKALTKEGNGCLPLILGDGSIVSSSVYPSRSELMELAGIGGAVAKEEQPEDAATAASKNDPKSPTTLCGPGCDCRAASGGGKAIKTAISLLVLLAVVGILLYTGSIAKQTASNDIAAGNGSSFSVVRVGQGPTPEAAGQSPDGMGQVGVIAEGLDRPQPPAGRSRRPGFPGFPPHAHSRRS